MVAHGPFRVTLLVACLLTGLAGAPARTEAAGEAAAGARAPLGEEAAPLDGADPLFDEEWDEEAAPPPVYDPLEEGNRAVLRFNQRLDAWLWEPVTRGYRFVVPEIARRSVRRVFRNLQTPVYLVNHVLQLRPLDAAETLGAFVMNTTWGLGGIFDAASAVYLEPKPADFGQTLALAGVPAGPYLMIPLFGPTTTRDGVGGVVDLFLHPLTYVLGIPTLAVWEGSEGVTRREAAADQLDALEASSLDYYSVLRSAYMQARERSIDGCRRGRRATLDAFLPRRGSIDSATSVLAGPGAR